jgi:hypothetical protein
MSGSPCKIMPISRTYRSGILRGTRELIGEITSKAPGVFLWVHLVAHSLLNGLANGDDMDILLSRVRGYPEDLDEYYQRLFDRIERVYHQQSVRLILITLFAVEQGYKFCIMQPISFKAPRCLELEAWCSDYARLLHRPALCEGRRVCSNGTEIKNQGLPEWKLELLGPCVSHSREGMRELEDYKSNMIERL